VLRSPGPTGGDAEKLCVLGFDAAGVVVEVGDQVTLFAPGDEVWYAGDVSRPGTNSELHLVDERIASRKPTTLTFGEAAALPLTAITAWEGLFDMLSAESRGTLYVAGASGGVGSMVLQLVEALLPGVRVVATSSRPETDEWVRGLGAEAWVDRRNGDLREQLGAAAPDGIDWVFTSYVAEPGQLDLYVSALNPFGEIVAIDDPNGLDIGILKSKSISFHWELMFTRALAGGDAQLSQHRLLERVAELVEAGKIRSTATTELQPISVLELAVAEGQVETGRTIGKVVVAESI